MLLVVGPDFLPWDGAPRPWPPWAIYHVGRGTRDADAGGARDAGRGTRDAEARVHLRTMPRVPRPRAPCLGHVRGVPRPASGVLRPHASRIHYLRRK